MKKVNPNDPLGDDSPYGPPDVREQDWSQLPDIDRHLDWLDAGNKPRKLKPGERPGVGWSARKIAERRVQRKSERDG